MCSNEIGEWILHPCCTRRMGRDSTATLCMRRVLSCSSRLSLAFAVSPTVVCERQRTTQKGHRSQVALVSTPCAIDKGLDDWYRPQSWTRVDLHRSTQARLHVVALSKSLNSFEFKGGVYGIIGLLRMKVFKSTVPCRVCARCCSVDLVLPQLQKLSALLVPR